MNRRTFLRLLAAGTASAAFAEPTSKTFVYKVAGNGDIKADVLRPPDDLVRPVVVWIHGGALIMGRRELGPPGGRLPPLIDLYLKAGYAVVSIDYRLAPETKLPAIIEDVQDAYRWVRQKGPDLFHIDPSRIAVSGGSAGGYLTLMTGFCVEPRPKALVPLYGYGDIAGPWYSRPDPFYSRQPAVPKEEAYGAVGGPVLSQSSGNDHRQRFYLYCRQQGLWPREVTGHDPDAEPRFFDRYSPVRNVTSKYPPTMLLHGDKDTDVPYELSVSMAKELSRAGVENELITIAGSDHGFRGADPQVVQQAYERAVAFVKRHLA